MVCSMLIKHDCTTGGERKCSKQGFISLVFQAAVFSLSITGRKRETEREGGAGGEIVVEMRWEHKPGKIRVVLFHRLLSRGGLVSRPQGTCLSEGLSPTEHRSLHREPRCFAIPWQRQRYQQTAGDYQMVLWCWEFSLASRCSSHATHRNAFSLHQGLWKATLCRSASDRWGRSGHTKADGYPAVVGLQELQFSLAASHKLRQVRKMYLHTNATQIVLPSIL